MKRALICFMSIFFLSCSQSTMDEQDGSDQLKIEIGSLETLNKNYRNNMPVLENELPEGFASFKKHLNKISDFKEKLRKGESIQQQEINDFIKNFEKHENYAYFPHGYINLLKQSENLYLEQYKYIMLIENFIYQDLIQELTGSFFRFDIVAPYARTDKQEYKLNEDVEVIVGFSGLNTRKPYKIKLEGENYVIDSLEKLTKPIMIKASKRGNNIKTGELEYNLNNETVKIPFQLNFDVK